MVSHPGQGGPPRGAVERRDVVRGHVLSVQAGTRERPRGRAEAHLRCAGRAKAVPRAAVALARAARQGPDGYQPGQHQRHHDHDVQV